MDKALENEIFYTSSLRLKIFFFKIRLNNQLNKALDIENEIRSESISTITLIKTAFELEASKGNETIKPTSFNKENMCATDHQLSKRKAFENKPRCS